MAGMSFLSLLHPASFPLYSAAIAHIIIIVRGPAGAHFLQQKLNGKRGQVAEGQHAFENLAESPKDGIDIHTCMHACMHCIFYTHNLDLIHRSRRGREFFDQLLFHRDHLFEPPTIYHLQYYCRATFFLEYYALRRISK
ncbi:hypothetical protein C8R44DRAFT_70715 [Mycena epipterygia]|nr:hypothetical protein C8R44DRAFT_70715 [Mycena epipterygia]